MILKGSQRSGAVKLAAHLLRLDENDHVELHELRGFSANDLKGALREVEAIAKGTRCRQYLFSLSLNPPETERVTAEAFEAAVDRAEETLGLSRQPRAIVFHEKEGRRHAHVVWSRIDVEKMKAINLPFYKTKLNGLAKELYLDHGWRLPEGLRDRNKRNPLNFTQSQWQQAKRAKQDASALKLVFRECWSVSDNRASFARALEEQGFLLARGDRRGFVAVDHRGEVYSLSRWTGEKSGALKARLGDPADLPDVEHATATIASRMTEKLRAFIAESDARLDARTREMQKRKAELKERQRAERQALRERQEERARREAVERAARFRKGLRGLWDWVSGKTKRTRGQNEEEAAQAARRDAREREDRIAAQLAERRELQRALRETKREASQEAHELRQDVAFYLDIRHRLNNVREGIEDRSGQTRATPSLAI